MTYQNKYFNSVYINPIKWNISVPDKFFFSTICYRQVKITQNKHEYLFWLYFFYIRISKY